MCERSALHKSCVFSNLPIPPSPLPPPSFVRSPESGGESDSFGLQGAGSVLEQAGFSRGFSAVLRSRLPLRNAGGWILYNLFPPGFLIHRSPRRALPVAGKLGGGKPHLPIIHFFMSGLPVMMSTSPQAGCQEAILSRDRRIINAQARGMAWRNLDQRGNPQSRETPRIFSSRRCRLAREMVVG